MNWTLTAAVALAAALGTAGLAHAQTSTVQPTTPISPNTTAPGTMPNAPDAANPSSMNPPAPTGSASTNPSAAAANPSNAANPSALNNPSATASGSTMGSKQATMSQSNIQQAQQQLRAQGLYRGAIDGVMGPRTEQALSRFQEQNGLPQSADLDQQTMDRLMSSNTGANTTAPMGSTSDQPTQQTSATPRRY